MTFICGTSSSSSSSSLEACSADPESSVLSASDVDVAEPFAVSSSFFFRLKWSLSLMCIFSRTLVTSAG